VAVVTAANGGIGRAVCRRLLADGAARLFALDIDSGVTAFAGTLPFGQNRTTGAVVDCADSQATTAAFAAIEREAGRIDILVNGVALPGTTDTPAFADLEWPHFELAITTSLLGMACCARQVAPGMRARRHGRIINLSSGAWRRPWPGASSYATAKAGVIGLTHALAIELAPHGVTVNAVSPGPIRTAEFERLSPAQQQANVASIPMGRIGEPEDVAAVISFLAGEDSGFVTGADIPVNGGRVLF
jgi:NAD(P)-dependent dehydrogenase (short-subunit alcohol dehydrogenase family)